MPIKRLMRQTRTIIVMPSVTIAGIIYCIGGTATASTLVPFSAPTTVLLNKWQAIITANATDGQVGGNISGAVLDNVKLGLGSSSTDSTLLITSVGNEVSPTLTKVDATLELMRDVDPVGNGVFNLAWQLLRRPDISYVVADRVQGGKKSTDTFSVGDVVDLYSVKTDQGIDNIGDQKYTTMSQGLVPDGFVNPNYSLAA